MATPSEYHDVWSTDKDEHNRLIATLARNHVVDQGRKVTAAVLDAQNVTVYPTTVSMSVSASNNAEGAARADEGRCRCNLCDRVLEPGMEALFCAPKRLLVCVPCNTRHLYMAQRCVYCGYRWYQDGPYCPQWVEIMPDAQDHRITRDACPCTFGVLEDDTP